MEKKGYQIKMKCARSVGEITTTLLVACFLVLILAYSYFSASSDTYSAHRRSEKLNGQTSSVLGDDHIISEHIGKENTKNVSSEAPPILSCNLIYWRSEVCEIYGNVRIHGNSSSILFTPDQTMDLEANKTWTIQPYTRNFDNYVMKSVREVTIKSLYDFREVPKCNLYHNITAVVFSLSCYMGNFFHDFSDVLLPLYITAQQFEGEVQILIANMNHRWIEKHEKFLNQITNYEIIDFNTETQVHCYPRVIVGLYSHGDFQMDPSKTPNNYSMVDFARLMRRAYSLKRDFAINLVENSKTKPKLLIIARNHTRKLVNIDEVVAVAMELGFEVVVGESSFSTNVGEFARVVNSVDVMMGVHGAGLTNEVFLPTNAVLIQIIPFGFFENLADYYFGIGAGNMMLKYLSYNMSEEESTLLDLYPRDHAVFRDPKSFQSQGWRAMAKIYLEEQNVKLNMTRFKAILTRALDMLR